MASSLSLVSTHSALTPVARCSAAHANDPTLCEGPRAVVRVVDQNGGEATGCVHHAAALYAALVRSRVYPSPGHMGAVAEVYRRAQMLDSCPSRAATAA